MMMIRLLAISRQNLWTISNKAERKKIPKVVIRQSRTTHNERLRVMTLMNQQKSISIGNVCVWNEMRTISNVIDSAYMHMCVCCCGFVEIPIKCHLLTLFNQAYQNASIGYAR